MNQQLVPDLDAVIGNQKTVFYVITTGTKDYGDKFTIRRQGTTKESIKADTLYVESRILVCETIEEARESVPDGLYRIERSAQDDPVIVETWL